VHLLIFIDFHDPYSILDDSDSLESGVWFRAILRGWDSPHSDALRAISGDWRRFCCERLRLTPSPAVLRFMAVSRADFPGRFVHFAGFRLVARRCSPRSLDLGGWVLKGDIPRAVLTLSGEKGGGVANGRLAETRTTIASSPLPRSNPLHGDTPPSIFCEHLQVQIIKKLLVREGGPICPGNGTSAVFRVGHGNSPFKWFWFWFWFSASASASRHSCLSTETRKHSLSSVQG
jgi:hypothetical protein